MASCTRPQIPAFILLFIPRSGANQSGSGGCRALPVVAGRDAALHKRECVGLKTYCRGSGTSVLAKAINHLPDVPLPCRMRSSSPKRGTRRYSAVWPRRRLGPNAPGGQGFIAVTSWLLIASVQMDCACLPQTATTNLGFMDR